MAKCKHGVNTDKLICTQCQRIEAGSIGDYDPFKPPFRYDSMGVCIFDSDNNLILDLRGWGYLTGGGGGLGYDSEKAALIQDNIGKRIAEIMTKDAGA